MFTRLLRGGWGWNSTSRNGDAATAGPRLFFAGDGGRTGAGARRERVPLEHGAAWRSPGPAPEHPQYKAVLALRPPEEPRHLRRRSRRRDLLGLLQRGPEPAEQLGAAPYQNGPRERTAAAAAAAAERSDRTARPTRSCRVEREGGEERGYEGSSVQSRGGWRMRRTASVAPRAFNQIKTTRHSTGNKPSWIGLTPPASNPSPPPNC